MHTRQLILQGLTESGWFWFCTLVCVSAAVLVGMLLKYERSLVPKAVGNTLLALRLAVLGVLFLTLMQPVVAWVLDRDRSGRIIVAVDVSQSMDTADSYADDAELLRWARRLELIGNPSIDARLDEWIASYENREEPTWVKPGEAPTDKRRAELARLRRDLVREKLEAVRALPRRDIASRLMTTTSAPLLQQLSEIGDVEIRAFAGKAETIDEAAIAKTLESDIETLVPELTDLTTVMNVGNSDDTSRTIGVVLLSDGRHNGTEEPSRAASRLGTLNAPLIPVMIGSEQRPKDISIISIDYPQVAFRDDTPVVKARLAADGYRNEQLTVLLEKTDGLSQTRIAQVPDASVGAPFVDVEFPLDAGDLGRHEYTLRTDILEGETREDNNERLISLQIVDDQSHVLLVDGEARWEFRFIDNALTRDERVDLKQVVFRQPHIGLLPETFFPDQLSLPDDIDQVADSPLGELDLLIVGDVSPTEMPHESWRVIDEFVRNHGGTLVLLAGKNDFPARHFSPALKPLLPVTNLRQINLRNAPQDAAPAENGFHLQLTPEAESEAMFQLDNDQFENLNVWSHLPGHSWGLLATARPGATVFATARRADEPSLADERANAIIVHQYYGFGQVLWIGIDSTWRWRHRIGDRYHHRFWGQLARWAARNKASAGNDFVRLSLQNNQLAPGDDAVFEARWQSRFLDLNPELKAFIELKSQSNEKADQPHSRVELTPVDGRPLLSQARAVGLTSGTWTARLVVENANLGTEVSTSLYVSEPLTGELSDLSANRELLTNIAELSGGQLLLPHETDSVAELLKPPDESSESREETTLWDHWLFLVLFFSLLTAEWVTRKLHGLP